MDGAKYTSRNCEPDAVQVTVYRAAVKGWLPTNLGSMTHYYSCTHDHETRESARHCQASIERAFERAAARVVQELGVDVPDREVEHEAFGETTMVRAQAGRIIKEDQYNAATSMLNAAMRAKGFVS